MSPKKTSFFLIGISIIAFLLRGCSKNPASPEPFRYRSNVEITYARDEGDITNPEGDGHTITFWFWLYDPGRPGETLHQGYMISKSETGAWSRELDKVFIQSDPYNVKHEVWVHDLKLLRRGEDGNVLSGSGDTGERITVNGAYDLEIVKKNINGSKLRFRMR